jgi:hypothetical protein
VPFVTGGRGKASVATAKLTAMLTAPTVWMLVVTTSCAASPSPRLRQVSVSVDRPTAHVALVRLDHGVTPVCPVGSRNQSPAVSGMTYPRQHPAAGQAPGGYQPPGDRSEAGPPVGQGGTGTSRG